MKSLKLGMVDLDTSHPKSFLPAIRAMGHEVTAVFDGGAVNPPGFAETFARENGIAGVYDSVQAMAQDVDAVLIHSCNWDVHVDRARPFAEAGKGVFIDKPLAGTVRDLRQLLAWNEQGARITGGSSLRWSVEVQSWLSQGIPREEWVYALVGCAVDEFNYGIHAYSMLHGLLGPGVTQARHLGQSVQNQVELTWADGRTGIVSVGRTAGYLPFYANIVTQKKVEYVQVNNALLYQALLEQALPYLAGEAEPPLALSQLVEVELSAIAAKLSQDRGGVPVALSDIPDDYAGYDGAAFAEQYKALKYPPVKA